MPGDVILGGLFPVHEKSERCEAASSSAKSSHYTICCRFDLPCGEQLYDRGLQRLEAMLYAVDRFNLRKCFINIIFIYLLIYILMTQYFNIPTFISRINDNKSLLPDIRLGKKERD